MPHLGGVWRTRRSFKAENFGRMLFTGDGIHPAVASALVPGSGFAGGATFGGSALTSRHLRLSMSADALAATNGSWQAGGGLTLLGSARKRENDHNNAVIDIHHQHLAELTWHFGPSNDSVKTSQTAYALDKTIAAGQFVMPIGRGFAGSRRRRRRMAGSRGSDCGLTASRGRTLR